MPFEYEDPIIHMVRKGTDDDPYIMIKEALIVDKSGKVVLTEKPNKFRGVKVKDDKGNYLNETTNALPDTSEFHVDYMHKVVTFNKVHAGKQFEFHYFGEGNTFIPANSIYTERDGLTIKETLQQLTDTAAQVRDETRQTNIEVQQNENVRIENENKRKENENVRQQNEQQRQRNELTRQSQEASRQENTAKAISDAEKATENVNTQANYAKNQGDFAKSQGDYAKEQGDYAKAQGDYAKAQGDYAKTVSDNILQAPHLFHDEDTNKVYQYGFKVKNGFFVLTYEEVE